MEEPEAPPRGYNRIPVGVDMVQVFYNSRTRCVWWDDVHLRDSWLLNLLKGAHDVGVAARLEAAT
jgi:hypothetical protein